MHNDLYATELLMVSSLRNNERFTGKLSREDGFDYYRNLLFHFVQDTLESAYPLTLGLLTTDEWDELINSFYSKATMKSPFLWKMPEELIGFINEFHFELLGRYPFLSDLLMFEWKEIEVYMMEDKTVKLDMGVDYHEEVLLVVNPETELLHLNYPVHLKTANQITDSDLGDYFVCLHRHPENGNVLFTDLSFLSAYFIQLLLEKTKMTLNNLLHESCLKFNLEFSEDLKTPAMNFIYKSLQSKLILGFTNLKS